MAWVVCRRPSKKIRLPNHSICSYGYITHHTTSTRRGTQPWPRHRCTCGKTFENISSVLCFVVLGESGPPISQIIMSGLLSTMMLAPFAAEFELNLTKWSTTSMPRLMLPATRVSAASFPSIWLRLYFSSSQVHLMTAIYWPSLTRIASSVKQSKYQQLYFLQYTCMRVEIAMKSGCCVWTIFWKGSPDKPLFCYVVCFSGVMIVTLK